MLLFTLNIDMSNIIEWNVGLHGYKKCTLEINEGEGPHKFTTELLDVPFDPTRSIIEIFNDHLSVRQTKYVEVLYSGGIDSELVLLSCLKNNIPVIAMTLIIKINGMIINTHDLYYAEKFCRKHGITHKLIELDASKFYENGDHYNYLKPYYIIQPHIATHFWLIEQCSYFPIIGGDWPWVQDHHNTGDNVISPFRLHHASYERYMWDRGINGIGNMISYSLGSSYHLIKISMDKKVPGDSLSDFKARMYQSIFPELEPRTTSWGWENNLFPEIINTSKFNIMPYHRDLEEKLKMTTHHIKWNNTIKSLINTTLNENDKF
jgi:hypothetical protein